jgi:hypothetical protein
MYQYRAKTAIDYAKPACQPPPTNGKPLAGRKSKRLAPASHSVTVVGRGGSTRPHSRTPHRSLLEPAVTSLAAEPAPGSLDDIDEDVDRPSPSSSAAAALAAARAFSAASRSGHTNRQARSRPFIACRHHRSAIGRRALPVRMVQSNMCPTSNGTVPLED